MQCDAIRKLLHEEPQGAVSDPAIAAHLGQCSACRAVHEELIALAQSLRQLEPPELPEGFELALRRRLVAVAPAAQAAEAGRGSQRWRVARYLALAASLLVALGVVLWQLRPEPATQLRHYRLSLQVQAATDHPAAIFQITLPAGVQLAEGLQRELGSGRTVSWRSPLARGTSSIDLPLEGAGEGELVVNARLSVGGQSYAASTRILAKGAASGAPSPLLQLAWVLPRGQNVLQEVQQ